MNFKLMFGEPKVVMGERTRPERVQFFRVVQVALVVRFERSSDFRESAQPVLDILLTTIVGRPEPTVATQGQVVAHVLALLVVPVVLVVLALRWDLGIQRVLAVGPTTPMVGVLMVVEVVTLELALAEAAEAAVAVRAFGSQLLRVLAVAARLETSFLLVPVVEAVVVEAALAFQVVLNREVPEIVVVEVSTDRLENPMACWDRLLVVVRHPEVELVVPVVATMVAKLMVACQVEPEAVVEEPKAAKETPTLVLVRFLQVLQTLVEPRPATVE